ncbi:MAG: hypothetical protein M3119_09210 [Verrucomicrobiota bacterium]|nr:hypothetical protein [Verrucomicrobiota bacterium]
MDADLVIDAGRNLDISATITANTAEITAGKDLKLNTTMNVASAVLTAGNNIKYTVPFLSAAANGTLLSAPSNGRSLALNEPALTLDLLGGGVNPLALNGGNAAGLSLFEGGNGGTFIAGDATDPIAGNIAINAPINATTGANGALVATGGNGGKVSLNSDKTVTVNSTVKVSDSAAGKASKRGGNISLTSNNTSGTAIKVTNSGQLLALLSNAAPGPGGSIKFASAGGDISMSGTAKADRGTVEITNSGDAGKVNLTNATLHGDVVKAGALGNNGTLNIGGGTIDADTAIKLYAGGSSGTVNFTNNVTLSGTSVKTIAGDTVTIYNGKIVTINGSGPASVFTNNPNYTGSGGNGSTTGVFGGQGAITQSLSKAPGY